MSDSTTDAAVPPTVEAETVLQNDSNNEHGVDGVTVEKVGEPEVQATVMTAGETAVTETIETTDVPTATSHEEELPVQQENSNSGVNNLENPVEGGEKEQEKEKESTESSSETRGEGDKSQSITLPKVPENSLISETNCVDVNQVRAELDNYTPDHSSIRPSATHSEGSSAVHASTSRVEPGKDSTSQPVAPSSPTSEDMKKDTNANDTTPNPMASPEIERPSDIRFLTIKNLDTGEEFVIGENDPDFEFDTFEIGGGPYDETQATDGNATGDKQGGVGGGGAGAASPTEQQQQRKSWWRSFFNLIYGSKESKENLEIKIETASSEQANQKSSSSSQKTPFTKLSSFKFRKELGRGAFGRVLLAEAKTDGKLYALKIISKKNMRSSDKRQAKAERDILYAMTLKSPHPFTSGLKFAFQSENNLYLGMDFIPGGNLRELIKKFKYLPEVSL